MSTSVRQRQRYDARFKGKLMADLLEGRIGVEALVKKHGLSPGMLHRWRREEVQRIRQETESEDPRPLKLGARIRQLESKLWNWIFLYKRSGSWIGRLPKDDRSSSQMACVSPMRQCRPVSLRPQLLSAFGRRSTCGCWLQLWPCTASSPAWAPDGWPCLQSMGFKCGRNKSRCVAKPV